MIRKKDLLIRTIKEEDLKLLEKWETPEIRGRYQEYHFRSLVELREKYNKNGFISDDLNILIAELQGFGPVGLIFVNFKREGIVNLGLVITVTEKRGTGLGKRVISMLLKHLFNNYPLVRIEADTDHKNTGAQKVLQNCGFKEEGRLRSYRYHHGKWNDFLIYSLTRKDYNKLKEDLDE
ncbi:MAG: GNAT family protein [Halanaerobiales bacterium]